MYALRVSSGAPPAEAANYDGDHRSSPVDAHPVALAQPPRGDALEGVHRPGDRDMRRLGDEQVDVVVSPSSSTSSAPKSAPTLATPPGGGQVLAGQHPTPILGHED